MSTVMAISASPCVGDLPSTGLGIPNQFSFPPFQWSHIFHEDHQGYSPQGHRIHNSIEWFVHVNTWPLKMSQPWQIHPGSPWNWPKFVSQIWSGFIEIAPLLPAFCLHFTGLISECFKWQCLDTHLCFVLCLSKQFQCILYLLTFHKSWYHCSPGDHSTFAHLAEHSPSSAMVPQILCMSCQKGYPAQ